MLIDSMFKILTYLLIGLCGSLLIFYVLVYTRYKKLESNKKLLGLSLKKLRKDKQITFLLIMSLVTTYLILSLNIFGISYNIFILNFLSIIAIIVAIFNLIKMKQQGIIILPLIISFYLAFYFNIEDINMFYVTSTVLNINLAVWLYSYVKHFLQSYDNIVD